MGELLELKLIDVFHYICFNGAIVKVSRHSLGKIWWCCILELAIDKHKKVRNANTSLMAIKEEIRKVWNFSLNVCIWVYDQVLNWAEFSFLVNRLCVSED